MRLPSNIRLFISLMEMNLLKAIIPEIEENNCISICKLCGSTFAKRESFYAGHSFTPHIIHLLGGEHYPLAVRGGGGGCWGLGDEREAGGRQRRREGKGAPLPF